MNGHVKYLVWIEGQMIQNHEAMLQNIEAMLQDNG